MEALLLTALILMWLLLLVPAALITLLPANPFSAPIRRTRPDGPIPFVPPGQSGGPTGVSGGQAVA